MRIATVGLQCSASKPTSRMPLLQAVVLLTFGLLLPSSVQADGVGYGGGSPFFGGAFGLPSELSQGLELGGTSDPFARFGFSNLQAPMFFGLLGGGSEQVITGPLIAHTDTSWTFDGGQVSAGSPTGAVFRLPPEYSTCEAAGFSTYSAGQCEVSSTLDGTLTGDVVLSLTNVAPDTEGGFSARYDLTALVTFGISGDLARAAGVSAGPYFGSLSVEGNYIQDPFNGEDQYTMRIFQFNVGGTTVPEPSTFWFLLTALVCIYVLSVWVQLRTGKP